MQGRISGLLAALSQLRGERRYEVESEDDLCQLVMWRVSSSCALTATGQERWRSTKPQFRCIDRGAIQSAP
jgi:hypothetical protein